MVNLTKRIHKLMPLWDVKSGAGAAILPPKPPAPKLTRLRLNLPNPCNGHDDGARQLWRSFLPSLRYHNLTLPIVVEQKLKPGASYCPTMTLEFESPNRQDLEKIEVQPATSDAEAMEEAKVRFESLVNQERMAAIEGSAPIKRRDGTTWVEVLRKEQEEAGAGGTEIGEVQVKAQPAADPSAPSTVSPPTTMYSRSITLGLRGRSVGQIWSYFMTVTQARQYYRSTEDRQSKRKMDRFFKKADEDRERVRIGIDAMRREKADLKRAREAADRLSAEA